MAFRRTLAIRSTLFARRSQPSYHIIPLANDHERDSFSQETSQRSYHSFLHQRSVNNSDFSKVSGGGLYLPMAPMSAFAFYRYMSSAPGVGSEKIGVMSDIAEVITDSTLQDVPAQAAAAVSEVTLAAADSFFPIAALQHCIDMVHSFTGFGW